jgi:hypothetical protein
VNPTAGSAAITDALPAEPTVRRRNVVLVTGAPLAGSSSLVEELRQRMPGTEFVEHRELGPDEAPVAVVFVVSAAGPVTGSDCALLDAVARCTDAVIGVVSKIDVHRRWRGTVRANRAALSAHRNRYARVPWVGAAAKPGLGERRLDDLAKVLTAELSCPTVERRNALRLREFQLNTAVLRYRGAVAGADRQARAAQLAAARTEVLTGQRRVRSQRVAALRGHLAQARVELSCLGVRRVAGIRADLLEEAGCLSRREMAGFPVYAVARISDVLLEIGDRTVGALGDIAVELGLPPAPAVPRDDSLRTGGPPVDTGRLETRLMVLLGSGFGFGVAVTAGRMFAGLAPGWSVAAAGLGAVLGVGLTLWVVGMRGLLRDRAALQRWVVEAVSALRPAVDREVVARVLAAEVRWMEALARQDDVRAARAAEAVRVIDVELAEQARIRDRAVADLGRAVPALDRALVTVRAELDRIR